MTLSRSLPFDYRVGNHMRVLGIDPGLRRTGWGVIEAHGNCLRHVADGVVRAPDSGGMAARLARLHERLSEIITAHAPDSAAVEETFVSVNGATTLKLGQARGVALLAPALAGVPVAEYAANLVKKSVVGYGHAEKAQIGAMVGLLLPGATMETHDAADALAVAICHAHHWQTRASQLRAAS